MCLVASSWWSYWSSYAALTKQDVLRVPERLALGLHKTEDYLDHASADEPLTATGAQVQAGGTGVSVSMSMSVDAKQTSPERAVGDAGAASGAGGGNRNGHATREAHATESLAGAGKERAVPTMLARRPHEIDNSSLQVRRGGEGAMAAPCASAF